jgi:hypothetical protein
LGRAVTRSSSPCQRKLCRFYQRIELDELVIGNLICAEPQIDSQLDFGERMTAVPPCQRIFFRIAQSFKDGELFGTYAGQPELILCDQHRLLAHVRVVIAMADGIHHLLNLVRHGGIVAAKCGQAVPARVAACARLAGAGARPAALAAIFLVGRHLFR